MTSSQSVIDAANLAGCISLFLKGLVIATVAMIVVGVVIYVR